jgi:hypothetical protein
LSLPLDELPTRENVMVIGEELALALLESGKAKPEHYIHVVVHEGLTAATAHLKTDMQYRFRFVPVSYVAL